MFNLGAIEIFHRNLNLEQTLELFDLIAVVYCKDDKVLNIIRHTPTQRHLVMSSIPASISFDFNHQTTGYTVFGRRIPRIFNLGYQRGVWLNSPDVMTDSFQNLSVDRVELIDDPLL